MTSLKHDKKMTGRGKFHKFKYSPRLIRQTLALASPFGYEDIVKYRIRRGLTPEEALVSLDIVLLSEDGRITPLSAECYRRVAGVSVEEMIKKI